MLTDDPEYDGYETTPNYAGFIERSWIYGKDLASLAICRWYLSTVQGNLLEDRPDARHLSMTTAEKPIYWN